MRAALILLVAFPASTVASSVMTAGMTGNWRSGEVTVADTEVLDGALKGDSFSQSVGDTRVCHTSLKKVEKQVVAGTNYRFYMEGCSVEESTGPCAPSSCVKPECCMVQIFSQTWTKTLRVTNITIGGSVCVLPSSESKETTTFPIQISAKEKMLIDAWIQANRLNEFGDHVMTMYSGGTPLFNESTGTVIDRYVYIVKKHSDRPWQKGKMDYSEENVHATKSQGSVAGVFSMLGVFAVVMAAVAIMKMYKEQRNRFRYSHIRTRG
ncbi:hypothetical protein CCR75_004234 [Bremia lactucae]|uniref:Uncharacterized protein n=1 Tax=Bremia lactucae TaxID=4779 RepID=A0A976FR00_BRELC|nr:hypothetical protein CCR75_004234 [Bremia lactucae]